LAEENFWDRAYPFFRCGEFKGSKRVQNPEDNSQDFPYENQSLDDKKDKKKI